MSVEGNQFYQLNQAYQQAQEKIINLMTNQ